MIPKISLIAVTAVLTALLLILVCPSGHDRSETSRFSDSKVIVTGVVDALLDKDVTGDSVIPVGGDKGIEFLHSVSNSESDFPYPILDRWGNAIKVSRVDGDVWVIRSASSDQAYGNDDDIRIYVDKGRNTLVGSHHYEQTSRKTETK